MSHDTAYEFNPPSYDALVRVYGPDGAIARLETRAAGFSLYVASLRLSHDPSPENRAAFRSAEAALNAAEANEEAV